MFIYIENANNYFIEDVEIDMVQTKKSLKSYRSADRQGHLAIDACPNDRSVLYMQDQYRSDDI